MNTSQVELIRTSFEMVAPRGEELISAFYDHLFADYPGVRDLFPADMTAQKGHLLAAVGLVVKNADKLGELAPQLEEMGARHVGYGAEPAHYPAVRDTMLKTLGAFAGDAWTDEIHEAWEAALNAVAEAMIRGAEKSAKKAA